EDEDEHVRRQGDGHAGLHGHQEGDERRQPVVHPLTGRFSLRHTNRSPDHTSVTAQTLLSTRPWGSPTSRRTSSVTSVGTLEARFGQATQNPPAGVIDAATSGNRRSSCRRSVTKRTATSR